MENKYVIGLDYGTDSARALVVNAITGEILASSVKHYPRWMKGLYCVPKANQWRQHPKVEDAIAAMNSGFAKEYQPDEQRHLRYAALYDTYLKLGAFAEKELYN